MPPSPPGGTQPPPTNTPPPTDTQPPTNTQPPPTPPTPCPTPTPTPSPTPAPTPTDTNASLNCDDPGKDKHRFSAYGLTLPAGATVTGIEVRLDVKANAPAGSPVLCVELSWDGGATWTASRSTPTLGPGEATHLLGGAGDTWGRAWTSAEVSALVVRVTTVISNQSVDTLRVTARPARSGSRSRRRGRPAVGDSAGWSCKTGHPCCRTSRRA